MMRAAARLLPFAPLAALPVPVQAHLVNSGLGPFYNGTLHLLLSPGDLLAVLAVSLLAGQSGKASARSAAIMLPVAWGGAALAGLALGTGAALGSLEVALLILLGVLVAAGIQLPPSVMAPLAALTGLLHGLANAGAFTGMDSRHVAVAGIAAAVLVLTLLIAALAVSLRAAWTRIALRVGGSWIAAIGMLMLGWLLQGTS
jgi:hydrogenase/urease accessory protein HupE